MNIGFVGLSHLAINYLIASSAKGFYCTGFDNEINLINNLNKGKIPFHEPGLNSAFQKNKKKIKFSDDFKKLKKCNIVFIAKDIKTDDQGKSNLSELKRLISKTIKNLNKKSTLVLLCQLPTGTTRTIKWNKKNLYYQVETLIFGNAYNRALKPERIIIGKQVENQKISNDYLNYLKKFDCPLIDMNYESAELTKMSINMYLISTVTMTNLLSEVANQIGAKWTDIVTALKLDRRIGKYAYLKPGLGITGGNLERDLYNIINLQKKYNLNFSVNKNIKNYSFHRRDWIIKKFIEVYQQIKIKKIAMLGLAYKENTNSIKNSVAIKFIKKFKDIRFYTFDPKVKKVPKNIKNVIICDSIKEALKKADILIICTAWEDFRRLKDKMIYSSLKYKIVIDPFSIINNKNRELKLIKLNH